MKNEFRVFVLLVLFSSVCFAESSGEEFVLVWTDFFPSCAYSEGDYNPARCACEFIVPNLHIEMMGSMFSNLVMSFIMLDEIIDFWNDPIGSTLEIGANLLEGLRKSFFPDPRGGAEGEGVQYVIADFVGGIINWMFGVMTPFIAIILLMAFEFIKDYLLLAIPALLWIHVLKELSIIEKNPDGIWAFYLALFVIILMLLGSLWLLGSDLGLYKPLLIF